MAVVAARAWRRTWPTSVSEAPFRSMAVAALCRSRCGPKAGSPARRPPSRTTSATPLVPSAPMGARTRRNSVRQPGHCRAAIAQVSHQGLANVTGKREPVPAAPLPRTMISPRASDVIECKGGRLTAPQAEAGQQHENGEVPPSHGGAPVTAGQQHRHRPGLQRPGQGSPRKASRGRHRPGQLLAGVAGQSKNRSSDRSPTTRTLADATGRWPHCTTANPLTCPAVELSQVQPARLAQLAQEQPGRGQVGADARGGQAPLAQQVATVVPGQHLRRGDLSRRRVRHRAQVTQVAQQRRQRPL